MRPPECAVCGDEFTAPDGRLVTFAERDSDRQWRERVAAERMVGHPPNVEWFCGVHGDAAAALAGLTIDAALTELKRKGTDDAARKTAQLTVTPIDADEYSVSATVGRGFEGSVESAATQVLLLGRPGPELQALLDTLVVSCDCSNS